ncbi:MAG: ATP synthase F1 subunit delta [Candidatus Riflebacteria bacterium]|nr:ATP synthase F1 subunit delta [Candidatus Riflebacteria bacterium]
MIPLGLARRYARALFMGASRSGETDAVEQDLQLIDATLRATPTLGELLGQPRIPTEEKDGLLMRTYQGRIGERTLEFLRLVLRKKRHEVLPFIEPEYRRMMETQRNQLRVHITSAFPLEDGERGFLTEKLSSLTGHQILLEEAVEPRLLGGIVIRYGDKQIDGSLRSHLDRLRLELKETRVIG